MNPNLQSLTSLQMEYDNKLQEYNQVIADFLQETRTRGLAKSIKKEREILRKKLRSGDAATVTNLESQQKSLLTDDILVNAISKMKKGNGVLGLYPNKVYWGSNFISEGRAKNTVVCLRRCQKNKQCTGAWYDNTGKWSSSDGGWCQLRGGPGGNERTWVGRYAIMNKLMVKLNYMKELNQQLLALNERIATEIKTSDPNLDTITTTNDKANLGMENDHVTLVAQREILDARIRKYDSTAVQASDTDKLATQSLLVYRLFILLAVFVFYVPVMWKYGPPRLSVSMVLLALILLLLNMKTIAFYVLVVTIFYLCYNIPLE